VVWTWTRHKHLEHIWGMKGQIERKPGLLFEVAQCLQIVNRIDDVIGLEEMHDMDA